MRRNKEYNKSYLSYVTYQSTKPSMKVTLPSPPTLPSNTKPQKNPKIQSSKTTEAQLKSLDSISKLIYDNNTARLYKANCRKTNQPVIIKRMLKTKSSPDEITLAVQANQVRIVES